MITAIRSSWYHWRFRLNVLLLLLPIWYIYSALTPGFPDAWPEKSIGPFSAIPRPADHDAPYSHDGKFIKDFHITLCNGCMSRIRTGYVSIGTEPPALSDSIDGVLHGNRYYQEAHAISPEQIGAEDKLWITLQEWNGQLHHAYWDIEPVLINQPTAE